MNFEDQIRAIQALGYSQPEAQFLHLVALRRGYFVRRQFVRSFDCRGKRSKDFLDEMIARGHARREVFREDRHIFRLQSRTIYELLSHDDLVSQQQQEKLSYFFELRGIDAEALPARLFNSSGTLTTRYFPDIFSQFLRADKALAISFVYVDDAQLTSNAFRSFLRNYRGLFERLGNLDFVFVTTAAERIAIAQKTLARFRARTWENTAPSLDLNRLLAHFLHRLLYEKRATPALKTAEIHALHEDLHTLCSPQIENLYAIWKQDGVEGLRAELAAQETPAPPQINLANSVLE